MSTHTSDLLNLPARLEAPIKAAAEEMEVGRDLPTGLLHQLRDAGAFRLLTPYELGGFEAPLESTLRVYEGSPGSTPPWRGRCGTPTGVRRGAAGREGHHQDLD